MKGLVVSLLLVSLVMGQGAPRLDSDRAYQLVMDQLKDEAIPAQFVQKAFLDPTVRVQEAIVEKFNHPYEARPYEEYRQLFVTDKRVKSGVQFYRDHQSLLDSVVSSFGVDPFILVSIVGVESNYGSNHAQFPVFNALYTVIHRLPGRSAWAVKELATFLAFSYQNNLDPLSIMGSYAGAFGYGQFIPSSFSHYAVDFNGDGVRHYYDWPDVLASIANYLVGNGYDTESTDFSPGSKNWKAIYAYNHADNYVKVILELRRGIKARLTSGG
jgi:membrane-bound lytic murein transglycosylase B